MASAIRVLGISGSLRKGSFNTSILRAAGELLPEGMSLDTFDISPIPLYNEDVRAAGPRVAPGISAPALPSSPHDAPSD